MRWFYYLFLWALLFLIYSPVVIQHPTLDLDDRALLDPLTQVSSLGDYQNLVKKNIILDVQPVRDLSFWLEIQFEKISGWRNSQLINLIFWWAALALLFEILRRKGVGFWIACSVVTVIGVHPVATTSVAWTASRKHLLSLLFVSLMAWLWFHPQIQKMRYQILFLFCYLFMGFSQPINLLFPWVLYFVEIQKTGVRFLKEKWVLIAGTAVIAVTVYVLNRNYYLGEFVCQTGLALPKYLEEEKQKLIFRIMVWGRSFYQLLIPTSATTVPYNILKEKSVVGIFMLSIFFAWSVYSDRIRKCWDLRVVLLLVFCPLMVMTFKLTVHLGWDTYMLSALWSLGFLAILLKNEKRVKIVGSILIVYLGWISHSRAQLWLKDESVWRFGYESEGTAFAQENYARVLVNQNKDWELAKELIQNLEYKRPKQIRLPYLKSRLFFYAPYSFDKKKQLFLENEMIHPWYQYYFAALFASEGRYREAHERLEQMLPLYEVPPRIALGDEFATYVSKWTKMCVLAGEKDCEQRILNQIQQSEKSQPKPNKCIVSD